MTTNAKADANPKQTTLRTLAELKAKLYANATKAIAANPTNAEAIQNRTTSDAAQITFAMNLVHIKM